MSPVDEPATGEDELVTAGDEHVTAEDGDERGPSLSDVLLASPEVAPLWQTVELSAGERLFDAGDPGDALYIVVDGEIDVVTQDGIELERLGPGACLGEIALLDGGVRSAGARARSSVRLERLDRESFQRVLPASAALSNVVIRALETRARRNTHYLKSLMTWAQHVGNGDYAAAKASIEAQAIDSNDANVARFVDTFIGMVSAVQAREEALRREMHRLRIEIDRAEQAEHVAEIAQDDYFVSLQAKADELRARMKRPSRS